MCQYIKADAPQEFVEAVQTIEDRADQWAQDLPLLGLPRRVARSAVFTAAAYKIELGATQFLPGSREHRAACVNWGGAAAELLFLLDRAENQSSSRRQLGGDLELGTIGVPALNLALHYTRFRFAFPLWHKSFLRGELVSPAVVRFSDARVPPQSRAHAYMQGIRPAGWQLMADLLAPQLQVGERETRKILNLVLNARRGHLSITYSEPWRLWREIKDIAYAPLGTIFRRQEESDLGGFSLGQFRHFSAALLSICAVHEHACSLTMQVSVAREYPLNSALLVWSDDKWVRVIHRISGIDADVVRTILRQMTFGSTNMADLNVHPFVWIDQRRRRLAVCPGIARFSNYEENVMQICSRLDPAVHGALSATKEEEMRREILEWLPPHIEGFGPQSLPSPLPDIDLVLEDRTSQTVVIAEMKWLRQPFRPVGLVRTHEEFIDSFRQIEDVRQHLRECPNLLCNSGMLSRPLDQYELVQYIVLARDFLEISADTTVPAIEYEAFKQAVQRTTDLASAMAILVSEEWLPQEGRDFYLRNERSELNGVGIESLSIYGQPQSGGIPSVAESP